MSHGSARRRSRRLRSRGCRQKGVVLILGSRRRERLDENAGAAEIELSEDERMRLADAVPLEGRGTELMRGAGSRQGSPEVTRHSRC